MARAPRLLLTGALALLASALLGASAFGSAKDVIRDCSEDGVLNGKYSPGELAKALDQLPTDLDEYTDCRAVIRSAELRSARKRKGGPGIVGEVDTVSPPSAAEQREIEEATRSAGPVNVGGKRVTPGFSPAGLGTGLPPLVLAVLLALGGAMIAGAALALQRRRPALERYGGPLVAPIRKLTNRLRDGIARLRR